jgi:hypothetical protein
MSRASGTGRASRSLCRRVFDSHDYYWPDDPGSDSWEPAWPTGLDGLAATEHVVDEGTHSILDIRPVPASGVDGFGTLLPARVAEVARRSFGFLGLAA